MLGKLPLGIGVNWGRRMAALGALLLIMERLCSAIAMWARRFISSIARVPRAVGLAGGSVRGGDGDGGVSICESSFVSGAWIGSNVPLVGDVSGVVTELFVEGSWLALGLGGGGMDGGCEGVVECMAGGGVVS